MSYILRLLNKQKRFVVALTLLLFGFSNFALAQNNSVLEAQQFLIQNGYSLGTADGIMGRRTRSALIKFQRDRGILESGKLDEATQAIIHGGDTPPLEVIDVEDIGQINSRGDLAEQEPPVATIRTVETVEGENAHSSETSLPDDNSSTFQPLNDVGESQILAADIEETKPHSEREVPGVVIPNSLPSTASEPKNIIVKSDATVFETGSTYNFTKIAMWLFGILTLFWIFRQHNKKQKNKHTAGVDSKHWDSKLQKVQSDGSAAHLTQNTRTQPLTDPYSALNTEEKGVMRKKWGIYDKTDLHNTKTNDPALKSGLLQQTQKSGWFQANHTANIAGRSIGGMIYVGSPPRSGRYGGLCGAFIDPSLSVAKTGGDREGHGMHYWPNYSDISATARATYLDWLQSGRSDPNYNAGYMFLYFYGLERRFLLDDPSISEKGEILEEVIRLRQLFSENHSVQNYLNRFIDIARISLNLEKSHEPIFSHRGYDFPLSLSIMLGGMIKRNKRLTSDWTLSWLLCHPERRLRTPAHRCEEEFHALFRLKFKEQYPDGMKVRCPQKILKVNYQAASGEFDLAMTPTAEGGSVPDISGIRKPLNDAQKIADIAMDELDKFSRYLGRNPDGRGTIEAQALLPDMLWSLFPSVEFEALTGWADAIVAQGGLAPIVDIVEKLENARPDKINKRQLTGAADALARLGFGMAPDPRFALRGPKFGDPVVLFELPEGVIQLEDVSDHYRFALLELALGTFIAQADGKVVQTEEDALKRSVQTAKGLTLSERTRLEANLTWLLAVPPDMGVFRTKLKNATEEQRGVIRQVVVSMAHADAIVRPEEIGGIEKVYKALGLDPALVYTDIHAAAVSDNPVSMREAQTGEAGEAIPREQIKNKGTVLDAARIAAIQTDTARVSSVLSNIFGTEDAQNTDEIPQDDEIITQFNGLDAKHSAFASELIEREHWNERDFDELSGRYGLMPSGCLETINEWAFEHFNDALIEEYDGYELNPDITHTLREK
ncbi:MAG: TerB N-terminal domain-containing protein [Rhizobiaceae bacterium]